MTQSYADYLSSEAESELAAIHQFRLLYRGGADELHLFFEGDDDSLFYMPEIRRKALGKRPHIYVCGGKKNVESARNSIREDEYDITNCLFFIDRDFDDYIGTQIKLDRQTYITDSYSIENDVISIETLEVILDDLIRVSRADPEFENIKANYREMEDAFWREIRPFMAWSIAAKQAGSRPNFNNVKMSKIFRVANDNVQKRPGSFVNYCRACVGGGGGASREAVLAWRRRLPADERRLWIRGKFYLWFFQAAVITAINNSSERRKLAGGRAWRIPAGLRDARFFEILGGRINLPMSLKEFLSANLEGA